MRNILTIVFIVDPILWMIIRCVVSKAKIFLLSIMSTLKILLNHWTAFTSKVLRRCISCVVYKLCYLMKF